MSTLQDDIKRLREYAGDEPGTTCSTTMLRVCDALVEALNDVDQLELEATQAEYLIQAAEEKLEASLKEIARLEERPNITRERLRQIRAKMRRRWEENRSLAVKLERCIAALKSSSKTLDDLGFVSIDGDKAHVGREAWSDAMAMRDEIDGLLKELGKDE